MQALIDLLSGLSWRQALLVLFAENALLLALALGLGAWLQRRFRDNRVAPPSPPLELLELSLAAATLLLNTLVTLVGWHLWREGWIHFRLEARPLHVLLDVALLAGVMDLLMYALHRVAHHPWLFPLLHAAHHRYDRPRPLTLFVLNPAETLAFGGLWLTVILLYDATWAGMSIYLALNVLFGLVGHLGVEPLPGRWLDWPGLRRLNSATFHAGHHLDGGTNYGFYTSIWDRLFGTMAADHDARFLCMLPGTGPLEAAEAAAPEG